MMILADPPPPVVCARKTLKFRKPCCGRVDDLRTMYAPYIVSQHSSAGGVASVYTTHCALLFPRPSCSRLS